MNCGRFKLTFYVLRGFVLLGIVFFLVYFIKEEIWNRDVKLTFSLTYVTCLIVFSYFFIHNTINVVRLLKQAKQ